MLTYFNYCSYIHDLYTRMQTMVNIRVPDVIVPGESSQSAMLNGRGSNLYLPILANPSVGEGSTEFLEDINYSEIQEHLFFGQCSPLASSRLALHSCTIQYQFHELHQNIPPLQLTLPSAVTEPPPIAVASVLFRVFSYSVNVFYPTIKENHLATILETVYQPGHVAPGQDWDIFYLIIAIGSYLSRKTGMEMAIAPHVYFQKAISHLEQSRHSWIGQHQLLLLQRTILICIFLLLSPVSGDIWRNLGFAIRFYFDLSHRPSEHDGMDEELMQMLTRTLYCLERYYPI